MKTLAVFVIAVPCCGFAAQDAAMPTFEPRKIGLPQLSLTEMMKPGQLVWTNAKAVASAAALRSGASAGSRTLISKMPVLAPAPAVDPNMPMVRPDPATDFKIIIAKPRVESAK